MTENHEPMADDADLQLLDRWQGLIATADPHTAMFLQLSRGWERVLGWSRAELRSKPFIEFVHPDDRAATVEAASQLAAGDDVIEFVNRYACKDGSYKWLSWESSVDADLPEAERVILASAHDITEQVETRQQLERTLTEAQSFRSVLEATSDLVVMARSDGSVTFVNQAGLRMIDRSADELLARPFTQLHPPDYRAHLREVAIPHALEHGAWSGEGEILGADERRLPISQVIVGLAEPGGEAHGLGTIIRDISQSKGLEDELRAQSARLLDALQAMSTPFIPITGEIVVMPLIGQMDGKRAEQVMEVALSGVASSGARVVILDLTGLATVDSTVAALLARTASSLRLLGTETILTGIQPAVAQTLVGLEIDLAGTTTRATLQSAIAAALRGAGAER